MSGIPDACYALMRVAINPFYWRRPAFNVRHFWRLARAARRLA